jgi:hypothetical protein
MSKEFYTLLLNFDETTKNFSCHEIKPIDYELKCSNTWFLFIYLDAKDGVFREYIPQAQLEIVFERGFPETTILFKQDNTELCKKTFESAPWHIQNEVANYIEETLNHRMSELKESGKVVFPMEVIEELKKENVSLKNHLSEVEKIKIQNQILSSELAALKNKWYFKFAKIFQKV